MRGFEFRRAAGRGSGIFGPGGEAPILLAVYRLNLHGPRSDKPLREFTDYDARDWLADRRADYPG